MDYEKKYKEALERARQFSEKPYLEDSKGIVDYIFPELKESEGDMMVKFIKNQLFNIKKTITDNYKLDTELTKAIDWLEKQGEHANFRNKIQIGDKVTRNEDGALVNLSQLKRVAKKDEKQGEQKPAEWSEEDELSCFESALFTAFSDAWQEYLNGEEVNVKQWAKEHSKEILEAAKEELKEQKPDWSEEDEKILNLIIARLHSHPNVEVEEYGKDYHWLNSLRDRVQPKQEWSEEDETVLGNLIWALENDRVLANDRDEYVNWLKSLRPQSTWKPSDEQMTQLKRHCPDNRPLTSLYEQLKKLREE